jgi:hypothetical protein
MSEDPFVTEDQHLHGAFEISTSVLELKIDYRQPFPIGQSAI